VLDRGAGSRPRRSQPRPAPRRNRRAAPASSRRRSGRLSCQRPVPRGTAAGATVAGRAQRAARRSRPTSARRGHRCCCRRRVGSSTARAGRWTVPTADLRRCRHRPWPGRVGPDRGRGSVRAPGTCGSSSIGAEPFERQAKQADHADVEASDGEQIVPVDRRLHPHLGCRRPRKFEHCPPPATLSSDHRVDRLGRGRVDGPEFAGADHEAPGTLWADPPGNRRQPDPSTPRRGSHGSAARAPSSTRRRHPQLFASETACKLTQSLYVGCAGRSATSALIGRGLTTEHQRPDRSRIPIMVREPRLPGPPAAP
jgi:hypothetical protein